MKIRLYVNWKNRKILKEEEYEKEIAKLAKDREDDDYELEEFLGDYLERKDSYTDLAYLFKLNKEDREKILELWKEDCLETVRNNTNDEYNEIEIEV